MKLIVFILMLVNITGCGVATFYRKGVNSFQKKQYLSATKWFELSIKNNEKKQLSPYFLGVSYERSGDHEKAILSLNKLLNNWNNIKGLKRTEVEKILRTAKINFAVEKGVKGDINDAVNSLIEILGPEYKFYLGIIYKKRGEYGKAIQTLYDLFLTQNEKKDNSFISELWYEIGNIYIEKYNTEKKDIDFYNACFALRMAVTLRHPSQIRRKTIENKFLSLKKYDLFNNYIPIINSYRKIYKYKQLNKYDDIINEANKIIKNSNIEDDKFIALQYSGMAHYHKKEYLKAIEDLNKVKEFTKKKLYLTSSDIYELLDKIYAEYKKTLKKGE